MDQPVASRILSCTFEGKPSEVFVSVGQPREEEESCFVCDYEISFAGKTETYKIAGIDGIHAIQLALYMIGTALHSLPGASNWTWNGQPYTGFPKTLDEPVIGLRS